MEGHSVNILGSSSRLADVKEFLSLLHYRKYSDRPLRYYFFKREHYKYHTGVDLELSQTYHPIEVQSWVYPDSNSFDRDYQLLTIRQLKARFGGYFETDAGKNRLPRITFPTRIKAESGCYLVYSRFQQNLARIRVYLATRGTSNFPPPEKDNRPRDRHPVILSNNFLLPVLVAAMEEYFRASFVALLHYSDSKRRILSKARLTGDDLFDVSAGTRTVESAYARHLSFQQIDKVCDNFADIDKRIDLKRLLRTRAKRSKQHLFDSLASIVQHRHDLIHRSQLDPDYFDNIVQRDISAVEQAVSKVYDYLIQIFNWQSVEE